MTRIAVVVVLIIFSATKQKFQKKNDTKSE